MSWNRPATVSQPLASVGRATPACGARPASFNYSYSYSYSKKAKSKPIPPLERLYALVSQTDALEIKQLSPLRAHIAFSISVADAQLALSTYNCFTMAGATSAAASLLRRQFKEMQTGKDIPGISCGLVNDSNMFEWEVMLMISDDCKYYGGKVTENVLVQFS